MCKKRYDAARLFDFVKFVAGLVMVVTLFLAEAISLLPCPVMKTCDP
jgi:hypothetical protein